MPPRSKIEQLPDAVRTELDSRLIQSGFSGYRDLAEWLTSQGFEIKKSALQTYGARFEDRISALKLATDQARAIVAESPDDEGAMSEALMRLVQEKLFSVLLEIEIDPAKINLNSLARSIAELGRASVTQKKYAQEVRERAQAAAETAEKIAKRGGLSSASVNEIRSAILGIAQ
ncbi:MAG TPA: DUF3486 family protein [Steroidobacteraceae bacterium]|nr:DUF3486 family protein [Steroidobacteraceae bacterium]